MHEWFVFACVVERPQPQAGWADSLADNLDIQSCGSNAALQVRSRSICLPMCACAEMLKAIGQCRIHPRKALVQGVGPAGRTSHDLGVKMGRRRCLRVAKSLQTLSRKWR
jgi:hypothetical protein